MLYKNAYKKLCSLVATLLLVFFLSANFYAAPGDLDTTFGNGGVVITKVSNDYDAITDIEVQPDGKVVTAGFVFTPCHYFNFCNQPRVLASINRYLPTGTLDKSFGKGGQILFLSKNSDDAVSQIALQPDGKIVAVGSGTDYYSATPLFVVFRYNSNGTLDASFGLGGRVETDFAGWFPQTTEGVVIQPDGKIAVIGTLIKWSGGTSASAIGVVRYNANGSRDNGFGTNGQVITTVGTQNNSCGDVALQSDGKIVVSGSAYDSGPSPVDYDHLLVRYESNGSLDSTFGTGGYVVTHIASGDDFANGGVALQPDGKILVNGFSGIARFNTNGSMDMSFAVNGIFSRVSGIHVEMDMALQPDGKIIAAGSAYVNSTSGFALTRLSPDGWPDTSFGTNGNVITLIDGGSRIAIGNAVALQPDGKILSGGAIYQSSGLADAAIVRYSGE